MKIYRRLFSVTALPFVICLCLNACNSFEYSPNVAFDADSPENLNAQNLAKIQAQTPDDTIKLILCGDTQRSYESCEAFVKKVNAIDNVDFVLLDGDISDFGLLQEMEWVHKIFSKLKVPYLGVIGNHDAVANGKNVFEHMYGPLNYSFVYDSVKFVCHDTNSREVKFDHTVPNLDWLRKEFTPQQGVNHFVAVAHVPPTSVDFDQSLFNEYGRILDGTPGFLGSLNAHNHTIGIEYPYSDNKPYYITNGVYTRGFSIIKIFKGHFTNEFILY
ncbi:metallophosphoesterase [Pedobacter sp. BS3]|uniref:metallophosphoesterase family protein n=1 Tax=Pedobacter sp. BS3 TaxID=2567937 RepID=UPI0011ED463E|nr:metallophosphoesterase [Pedobacter sp. BS3]TZF83844.1 metallophosphoesterase [Pedobacter sp. BS3]